MGKRMDVTSPMCDVLLDFLLCEIILPTDTPNLHKTVCTIHAPEKMAEVRKKKPTTTTSGEEEKKKKQKNVKKTTKENAAAKFMCCWCEEQVQGKPVNEDSSMLCCAACATCDCCGEMDTQPPPGKCPTCDRKICCACTRVWMFDREGNRCLHCLRGIYAERFHCGPANDSDSDYDDVIEALYE